MWGVRIPSLTFSSRNCSILFTSVSTTFFSSTFFWAWLTEIPSFLGISSVAPNSCLTIRISTIVTLQTSFWKLICSFSVLVWGLLAPILALKSFFSMILPTSVTRTFSPRTTFRPKTTRCASFTTNWMKERTSYGQNSSWIKV